MDLSDLEIIASTAPRQRGRPATRQLVLSHERDLRESDLAAAASDPHMKVDPVRIKRMSFSHHAAARLVAMGKSNEEIALTTNYATGTISMLKQDPMFQELVAYYASHLEAEFKEFGAKLANLAADTIESLHEDLHEGKLTPGQKLQVMTQALDRSGVVEAPKPVHGAAGATLNINFVSSPKAGAPALSQAPVLDLEVLDDRG